MRSELQVPLSVVELIKLDRLSIYSTVFNNPWLETAYSSFIFCLSLSSCSIRTVFLFFLGGSFFSILSKLLLL